MRNPKGKQGNKPSQQEAEPNDFLAIKPSRDPSPQEVGDDRSPNLEQKIPPNVDIADMKPFLGKDHVEGHYHQAETGDVFYHNEPDELWILPQDGGHAAQQ